MSVTLSLRVSSDKRKPGVKFTSAKEENIHDIIERLRSSTQNIADRDKYLDELEKAVDLKAQLVILRQVLCLGKLDSEDQEKEDHFYFVILVEVFLSLELKSPLRSGIKRILKECQDTNPSVLEKIMHDRLNLRFFEYSSNISTLINLANIICGCFDNFPLGVKSIFSCREKSYNCIADGLTHCQMVLGESESLGQSTELCQCVHALIRAALHICSLGAFSDTARFHELARALASSDFLPLDTRTNCGLLAATTGLPSWTKMLEEQLGSKDDMTSLCVLSGLIGSLSAEDLAAVISVRSNEKIALNLIFDIIMDIHSRNQLQPTMTLGVARTLVSLSRVLLSGRISLHYMLPRLLTYTWEHLEHVMDSVKHLAATLLQNIANIQCPEVDVHEAILAAIKDLPVWGRARHTALSTLLGKVKVSELVCGQNDINSLYEHLNQQVTTSHAVNAVRDLLKHHYLELKDKSEWKKLWIKPLLKYLDNNLSMPLQQVLSGAVRVCPEVIEYILSLSDTQVSLGTRLLCLRHAHKQGLLGTSADNDLKWRGLVDYDLLQTAIRHTDEQITLSCLALIVESPKSTEAFTPNELKLVMEYVSLNFNMESPASRQRSIALLCKFVSRFNDSRQVLERRPEDDKIQMYTECRQWLELSCIDSLFPGAAYSRRVTALHLLTVLRVTPTPAAASALLACLSDSYEDVKYMAMKLLITTPGLLLDFNDPLKVCAVIEKSIEQAGGVKPPECLTAAYLLTTLSQIPLSKPTLTAIGDKYAYCALLADLDNIEHLPVYCCLLIVVEHLTQQLSVANVSVLKAASSAPLYGLLFTAKLLLSQINLSKCKDIAWHQLISRLVELSFDCSHAVASVVNNESPEGHFPMDFDFDPTAGGEDCENEFQGVTSQMVLLCSWRTVKEVSLLLGFLVEKAAIALSCQERGLLTGDDLLKIGDFFTILLAEIKHRGAFEQAYVGFCKLVSRLWRLPSGHLRQLPLKWLEDTMHEICNKEENLCATRRSAGIPYMIQALICTQLEVGGLASIEPWVCRLLAMAESATVSSTTHTHALNILRALFRNTQLGEAVGIFVERAFVVTITSFSANSWMERNSATLLLSALMTRVFGVPRSKSQDHLSWKNKMTGRIFFQRYPKLFGFFQEELRKASQSNSVSLHPSLYPVLLILGRLYPSSLEGTDSNIQLTQFIADILVCASSNIYKTRSLAAKAVVALMSFSDLDSLINRINQPELTANLRHGLLLQVASFLKCSDRKIDQPKFKIKAEVWIAKLTSIISNKLSHMELEALFQILNIFSEKYFDLASDHLWKHVLQVSKEYLSMTKHNNEIASCLLRPRIGELMLKIVVMQNGAEINSLCCELLLDDMYEVQHTILDFISCLKSDTDCSQRFCGFFKTVTPLVRSNCKLLLFDCNSSCTFCDIFTQLVLDMLFQTQTNFFHPEDKAKILSVLKNWERVLMKVLENVKTYPQLEHLSFLIDLCMDSHDDVAFNAIYCLEALMSFKGKSPWKEEDLTNVCQLLVELTKPETKDIFYDASLHLVSTQFGTLQKSTKPVNRLELYKVYIQLSASSQWQSAVTKMCDSEPDVAVTATLLAALTLGSFVHIQADNSNNVGRVFDTGEVNDAFEEYILSKVCGRVLRGMCDSHQDLFSRPLDPDLSSWLFKETGLQGESLDELLAFAKIKILQHGSNHPCQFVNSSYQYLRLNHLKLNNIL